jgi:hypothetical protein
MALKQNIWQKLHEPHFQFTAFEIYNKNKLNMVREGLLNYLSKSKSGPSSVPWKRSSMDEAARHTRRQ